MSLALNVYCKNLSADLVPKMVKRLNDFDMVVEVQPNFTLDQKNEKGFVPFKFHLKIPYFDAMKDKDLKSGFELSIKDFDLQKAKDDLKPKLSFFDKLLGVKLPDIRFANHEIENRLEDCTKVVTFTWQTVDTFELRFASMTSAILTELTNGVCCYPEDDVWYDNKNIVEEAYREVSGYERSIKEGDFTFKEFDEW